MGTGTGYGDVAGSRWIRRRRYRPPGPDSDPGEIQKLGGAEDPELGMTRRGGETQREEADALEGVAADHAVALELRIDLETPHFGDGRHGARSSVSARERVASEETNARGAKSTCAAISNSSSIRIANKQFWA